MGPKIAIIPFLLILFTIAVDADRQCPDYCTRGTHYYDGVYDARAGECDYDSERCDYGCAEDGVSCESALARSCPDKCERGVFFHDGYYSSSRGCVYDETDCRYGCDAEGCKPPSDCSDYCEDGTFYSNGFPTAMGGCFYNQITECEFGCADDKCAGQCPVKCENDILYHDGYYDSGAMVASGCVYKKKTCYAGCASDGKSCNPCTNDSQCPDYCESGWFKDGYCSAGICNWLGTQCTYGKCLADGSACSTDQCTSSIDCPDKCENGTVKKGACSGGKCIWFLDEVCDFGCNEAGTACGGCTSNDQCKPYCDPEMGEHGKAYGNGKCDIGTKTCVYNAWEECKYGCNDALTECKPFYQGNLKILALDPVQVDYFAPLVQNKNTVFRIRVDSSYDIPIKANLKVTLPLSEWSAPGNAFETGTETIEVSVTPGLNEYRLPLEADAPFDNTKTTTYFANMSLDKVYPDVRLAPRPKISGIVSMSANISVVGTIEYGNESVVIIEHVTDDNSKAEYYTSLPMREWKFLFTTTTTLAPPPACTPFSGMGLAAKVAQQENLVKDQLNYILGTFPIADDKLSANYLPNVSVWKATESRSAFLKKINKVALESNYDYAVAITCGSAGGTSSNCTTDPSTGICTSYTYIGAVFIGAGAGRSTLAHEFNHDVTGRADTYSLDCLVGWGEWYCELPNATKIYCCYNNSENKVKHNCEFGDTIYEIECGGQVCWMDALNKTHCAWGVVDKQAQNLCAFKTVDSSGCDRWCHQPICQGLTKCNQRGGTMYDGPDDLPTHRVSEGFWVNDWTEIDNASFDFKYFMDTGSTAPYPQYWIPLGNTYYHCGPKYIFDDGYIRLLSNPRFAAAADPKVIIISGMATKNGTAEFDPFIRLPEGTISPTFDEGAYSIVFLDAGGTVLSEAKFSLPFYITDPDGGPTNEDYFAYKLEWIEGTKKIELRDKNGSVLATQTVSDSTPAITSVSLNAASFRATDTIAVSWKASDADGDDLETAVWLVTGDAISPLELEVDGSAYEFSASSLPEGVHRIRIRVTDGVNTAIALTEEFNVASAVEPPPQKPRSGAAREDYILIAVLLIAILTVLVVFLALRKRHGARKAEI